MPRSHASAPPPHRQRPPPVRAAVACARADEAVDPDDIVLWDNSLGGAHAVTAAADDPRIAAVVAQIPFNGFPRRVEGRSTARTIRLTAAILWDALRGKLGLTPHYVPLVGELGEVAITNAAAAKDHVRTLSGGDSLGRNQVAPRGILQMMRYRPAEAAARLTVPPPVCHAFHTWMGEGSGRFTAVMAQTQRRPRSGPPPLGD